MTWNKRVSQIVGEQKVYLFGKSLNELESQFKNILSESLNDLEKKIDIKYEGNLKKACEASSKADPLLCYLFKSGSMPSGDEILNYYEGTAAESSQGAAYVDLALILGKEDRAYHFANANNSEYEILDIFRKNLDEPSLIQELNAYKARCNYSMMNSGKTDKSLEESAQLTRLICDVLSGDMYVDYALSEFWRLGYEWDAFVLSNIVCPADLQNKFQKFAMPGLFRKHKQIAVICMLNDILTGDKLSLRLADKTLFSSIGIKVAYRLLKCDLFRLEESYTNNEEGVSNRMSISLLFQEILLRSLSEGEYGFFNDILNDFFLIIEKIGGDIKADMFHGLEKVHFRKTIEWIASVAETVNHVTRRARSMGCEQSIKNKQGPLVSFVESWAEKQILPFKPNDGKTISMKGSIRKLYTIAKAANLKDMVFTLGICHAIVTSVKCNVTNDLVTAGFTAETAASIAIEFKSGLSQSGNEMCIHIESLLFSSDATDSIYNGLSPQNMEIYGTSEFPIDYILEYFAKKAESRPVISRSARNSVCDLTALSYDSNTKCENVSTEFSPEDKRIEEVMDKITPLTLGARSRNSSLGDENIDEGENEADTTLVPMREPSPFSNMGHFECKVADWGTVPRPAPPSDCGGSSDEFGRLKTENLEKDADSFCSDGSYRGSLDTKSEENIDLHEIQDLDENNNTEIPACPSVKDSEELTETNEDSSEIVQEETPSISDLKDSNRVLDPIEFESEVMHVVSDSTISTENVEEEFNDALSHKPAQNQEMGIEGGFENAEAANTLRNDISMITECDTSVSVFSTVKTPIEDDQHDFSEKKPESTDENDQNPSDILDADVSIQDAENDLSTGLSIVEDAVLENVARETESDNSANDIIETTNSKSLDSEHDEAHAPITEPAEEVAISRDLTHSSNNGSVEITASIAKGDSAAADMETPGTINGEVVASEATVESVAAPVFEDIPENVPEKSPVTQIVENSQEETNFESNHNNRAEEDVSLTNETICDGETPILGATTPAQDKVTNLEASFPELLCKIEQIEKHVPHETGSLRSIRDSVDEGIGFGASLSCGDSSHQGFGGDARSISGCSTDSGHTTKRKFNGGGFEKMQGKGFGHTKQDGSSPVFTQNRAAAGFRRNY